MTGPGRAFVDLSHELADGMAPYPGLPAPRIGAHVDHEASRERYEGGDEFVRGQVERPATVGTSIDSPVHRFADREDLSEIPLERVAGLRGLALDAVVGAGRAATAELPDGDLTGAAVLLRTGWDRRWGTDAYWEPGPFVGEQLAARLVERRVGLVGVDFWNVDDTETRRRPVHTRLLGSGVLVVEHLCNLDRLPASGFRFFAPVLRIRRGASFPVRAFAEVTP